MFCRVGEPYIVSINITYCSLKRILQYCNMSEANIAILPIYYIPRLQYIGKIRFPIPDVDY